MIFSLLGMCTTGNVSHRFRLRFSISAGGVLWVLLVLTTAAGSHAAGLQRVAVVLSMEIHPYLQAVEGIQSRLAAHMQPMEVLLLEETGSKYLEALEVKIASAQFDILIAVGPEATHFLWQHFRGPIPKKIFTMVLNPAAILPPNAQACGISLNIPIDDQLAGMAAALPGVKTIGLIYDPVHNEDFARQAMGIGHRMGINVLPLMVHDRQSIPQVLQSHWPTIQGLWMIPDQTVISESLVRHIIKEAIVNGVAVFGYNRFFFDSGAAVSCVLDYADIGAQTSELALRIGSDDPCRIEPPHRSFMVNRAVLETLGIGEAPVKSGSVGLKKRSP